MSNEQWKQIPGQPTWEISSRGRRRRTFEARRTCMLDGRYITVAHLVAAAFRGPRPAGFTVGYRNGNTNDLCAENLSWTTRRTNTKRLGMKTRARVRAMKRDGASAKWLAKAWGVGVSTIYNIILEGNRHD